MGQLVGGPVRVRVPATSANLGPGYDTLGLALSLWDVVTAEVTRSGADEISVQGEGAGSVPSDASHLVHRAMVRAFEKWGVAVPGIRLHCENAIPHGRGLGSSSAAIVAGLACARALLGERGQQWTDADLLPLAADLEGHPDNVAPALLGGLTVAYSLPSTCRAARLDVLPAWRFVVLVPGHALPTTQARGLLPTHVTHEDAAFNVARAALLVSALTARPEHLLPATEDRLHQDHRFSAMPETAELIAALRGAGHAAVVSGAGPAVLAVVEEQDVDPVVTRCPVGWVAHALSLDEHGVVQLPS